MRKKVTSVRRVVDKASTLCQINTKNTSFYCDLVFAADLLETRSQQRMLKAKHKGLILKRFLLLEDIS